MAASRGGRRPMAVGHVWRGLGIVAWLLVPLACSPAAGSPAPTAPPAAATTAPSPTDELATLVELELNVNGGPDFPVAAFGSLWLLRPDQNEPSIARFDVQTGAIVADIPVRNRLCQATGASPDAIWACSLNGLLRINPATNQPSGEVTAAIGQYYGQLPFGAGSLWALGGEITATNILLRVDPKKMVVAASIPLGFNGGALAFDFDFDFDAVWITAPNEGKLVRFDPATGRLTDHLTGLEAPGSVTTGFGSLWVGLYDSRDKTPPAGAPTVARGDPATGKIEALIAVGSVPLGACIHAGTAGVWVRSPDPFLALIDPSTNKVVRNVRSTQGAGCVIEINGRLWVTSSDFGTVWRLAP